MSGTPERHEHADEKNDLTKFARIIWSEARSMEESRFVAAWSGNMLPASSHANAWLAERYKLARAEAEAAAMLSLARMLGRLAEEHEPSDVDIGVCPTCHRVNVIRKISRAEDQDGPEDRAEGASDARSPRAASGAADEERGTADATRAQAASSEAEA